MAGDTQRSGWTGTEVLSVTVAGALAAVAAATIWRSVTLDYWTSLGPGPGFLPFWVGVLLLGLAVGMTARQLRARRAFTSPRDHEDGQQDGATPVDVRRVVVMVGSLLVLAALLEVLGYQLSMLLFLFFQLKVLGRRGWLLSVVLALVGSFGVFTAFTRALTVDLPVSSVEFLRGMGL